MAYERPGRGRADVVYAFFVLQTAQQKFYCPLNISYLCLRGCGFVAFLLSCSLVFRDDQSRSHPLPGEGLSDAAPRQLSNGTI